MRAFETIIETRIATNKERLYFIKKKGNHNVIKGFVTVTSDDNYR